MLVVTVSARRVQRSEVCFVPPWDAASYMLPGFGYAVEVFVSMRLGSMQYTFPTDANPSRMLTQEEVRQKLLEFECTLLDALASEVDESYYAQLRSLTETVRHEFAMQQEHGTLTNATLQLGVRVSERLEQLGHLLHEQRTQMQRIHSAAHTELASILRSPTTSTTQPIPPHALGCQERRDPALNAKHMRDWFLRNLGHPFPTREEKERILAETNACIRDWSMRLRYSQIVLWFINTRRRSGWTSFLRYYARGDKAKLLDLAWAIQHEEGGTHDTRQWSAGHVRNASGPARRPAQIDASNARQYIRALLPNLNDEGIQAMRVEWSHIADRVRIGAKERVGEWVEEVIRTPSASPSTTSHRSLRRYMP